MSDNLAGALAKVQQGLTAVTKDKTAQVRSEKGSYSYTYADLASVSEFILPLLAANGLAWVTRPTLDDGHFVLAYSLMHGESGEREDGAYPLPDPTRGTPQQIGSAITYARRYCLTAVTGVATEDDDGKAASDGGAPKAARREKKAERGPIPPDEDPWANGGQGVKRPPETDPAWVADWSLRVAGCAAMTELRGLFDELSGQVKAGKVTTADAVDLRALIEERSADLSQTASVR